MRTALTRLATLGTLSRIAGEGSLHRLLLHPQGAALGDRRRLGRLERIGRCPARTDRVGQGLDPRIDRLGAVFEYEKLTVRGASGL